MTLFFAALIGVGIGFLGGLLGKGGSAIATPLLHAIGVPAMIAVASPLPGTIPSTMVASYAYSRERLVNWRAVRWSVAFGVPTTACGAALTKWISGGVLVKATDVVLVGLGIRILVVSTGRHVEDNPTALPSVEPSGRMLACVAISVGMASGLLANAGGFLLAPLFVILLHLPIRSALASSLATASMLAIPGTIVHTALGHVDWALVGVFAATSTPLSFLGARVAMRINAVRLERLYGVVLIVLGGVFLALG